MVNRKILRETLVKQRIQSRCAKDLFDFIMGFFHEWVAAPLVLVQIVSRSVRVFSK